jgi:hypothetical protein
MPTPLVDLVVVVINQLQGLLASQDGFPCFLTEHFGRRQPNQTGSESLPHTG